MQRRNLLRGAALLSLLPLAPAGLRAAGAAARSRVRPTDPRWPAAADWQALKSALGGNLLRVAALCGVCEQPDSAACAALRHELSNPFYLGDQPGGTQVSGWLNAWMPAASVYAVRARHAADVAAAVSFARTHHLRVAVKGGGHSYFGNSQAPDSLLIWTRAIRTIALHEAFVGEGCRGREAPAPAVSLGAGCMWIDAYQAVTAEAGRYVQGGGCTTVGVAGLIQSGGFGSFSKGFGNAAAGLIEAEVVTADGVVRIANAATHPDLYWALKGGGGGTFGVVTRVTLRTHELPEFFGAAWGTIRAHSDAAFRELLRRFLDFYATHLANEHWGEQFAVRPDNSLKISLVCQGLTRDEVRALWQPFFDWAHAAAGLEVSAELGAGAKAARKWWDIAGNSNMIADSRPDAPATHGWWQGDQDQVGMFLHGYDSLWLPAALLQGGAREHLVSALIAASRFKEVELHCNKGLAFAAAPAIAASRATAMNPDVTQAFALAIIADGEGPRYPGLPSAALDVSAARKDAEDIRRAAAELRRIAPAAGSYLSESNYFNERWQAAYYGPENYRRLRLIKKKYDPEGLFWVHHGVGSEEWSADGFTRLS